MIQAPEYDLLRESAGAVVRARGKLVLRGAEAAAFLQGQVTNDVEGLEPGTGCYALLLTHKGKVRMDMRILRGADWLWIDCAKGALPVLDHMIRTYGIGRDIRPEDVTDSRALTSVIGPAARERLGVDVPDDEHAFVEAGDGLFVATDLGVDVIGRTEPEVEPVSEEAAETVRIESGRPRFGLDFGADTIPEEAGLNERGVSFTKGCYVGQETVARLHYKGKPNRHLRGMRLSAEAERGEELRLGERVVGVLGSTAVSPVHGPIALALVRREAEPGDTVEVGSGGTTAEVVELPFRRNSG
ncbi:MAG: folate-binding protein [Actinomycetota bacterium]|nr:folate-binding protein [Actinomycetota bacterium]